MRRSRGDRIKHGSRSMRVIRYPQSEIPIWESDELSGVEWHYGLCVFADAKWDNWGGRAYSFGTSGVPLRCEKWSPISSLRNLSSLMKMWIFRRRFQGLGRAFGTQLLNSSDDWVRVNGYERREAREFFYLRSAVLTWGLMEVEVSHILIEVGREREFWVACGNLEDDSPQNRFTVLCHECWKFGKEEEWKRSNWKA